MYYPEPIERLIDELTRLPGVGSKTAQRLALHLLKRPSEEVTALARALTEAKGKIRYCSVCSNYTDVDPCQICSDERREGAVLCVVEDPGDVIAMERTREFRGRYHVLQGAISPMEGIGPDDIRLRELIDRLADGNISEVILATNPTVEGEATALYIARLVKPLGIRVTRIARGLPEGGDIDYVDEVTLTRALEGRREL